MHAWHIYYLINACYTHTWVTSINQIINMLMRHFLRYWLSPTNPFLKLNFVKKKQKNFPNQVLVVYQSAQILLRIKAKFCNHDNFRCKSTFFNVDGKKIIGKMIICISFHCKNPLKEPLGCDWFHTQRINSL